MPPLGTRVKKGDEVAEVRNLFGELLETVTSPVRSPVVSERHMTNPGEHRKIRLGHIECC